MKFFEKFKDKTISDVVDTAKDKVQTAMDTVKKDKMNSVLMFMPLIATAFIVFGGREGHEDEHRHRPSKTVINNYYYYGERRTKKDAVDNHKSCK